MSKTLIVLIFLFLFLLCIFVYVHFHPQTQLITQSQTILSPSPQNISATLSFAPDTYTLSATQSGVVKIVLTAQNAAPVSLIQLAISYDPTLLTILTITPGNFFANPSVLLNTIDPVTGRISYALQDPSGSATTTSTSTIATLQVQPTRVFFPTQTSLIFLSKTLIQTKNGENVTIATSSATLTILPSFTPQIVLPPATFSAQTPIPHTLSPAKP